MLPQNQAEEAIVTSLNETESEIGVREEEKDLQDHSMSSIKNFLWHGGSAWDAWFSCASNQVKITFFFVFLTQNLNVVPYVFWYRSLIRIEVSHR